jgi:hypothetical protein
MGIVRPLPPAPRRPPRKNFPGYLRPTQRSGQYAAIAKGDCSRNFAAIAKLRDCPFAPETSGQECGADCQCKRIMFPQGNAPNGPQTNPAAPSAAFPRASHSPAMPPSSPCSSPGPRSAPTVTPSTTSSPKSPPEDWYIKVCVQCRPVQEGQGPRPEPEGLISTSLSCEGRAFSSPCASSGAKLTISLELR